MEENVILQAINNLSDKVERLNDKVDNVVLPQMAEMQDELRKLSKTVARIEIEHGKKLEALFDAFSINSEKIESNTKRIKKCEVRLDKQEDEIYYLNSKI